MNIKRSGAQPSAKGPAEYFTGTVGLDPLFEPQDPSDQGDRSPKGLFAAHINSGYTGMMGSRESGVVRGGMWNY